jgi:hypothetical protein
LGGLGGGGCGAEGGCENEDWAHELV